MKFFISIILFLGAYMQVISQDIEFSGFLDSYHAVRVENPYDIMSSRSRFRAEIRKSVNNSSLFVSVNSIFNSRIPELSKIELREGYLNYTAKTWDIKIGRQIIIWGQADGIQVTDLISPLDLTEFLAQDYDDIRVPVNALKLRYYHGEFNIEGVFTPMYQANIIPSQTNPWGYDFSAPPGISVKLESNLEPSKTLENSEYGLKMSFNLSGFDFSALALNTFNKMPEFNMFPIDSLTIAVRPETHRLKVFGINLSKPLWKLVFRGDVALNIEKAYAPSMNYMMSGMQKSNSLNYLVAMDYYPGNDWNISLQFNHDHILKYKEAIGTNEDTYLGTINVSKPILRNTITLSTFAYVDLIELGIFDRTAIDIAASDPIHFLAGFDIFHGEKGVFGQYKKNSEIWIKAKYSF